MTYGDGNIEKLFPKVSVARGGISYPTSTVYEFDDDDDDKELEELEGTDMRTLADRRKSLADRLQEDMFNASYPRTSRTDHNKIKKLIEDALTEYAALVLEEVQVRLNKEA